MISVGSHAGRIRKDVYTMDYSNVVVKVPEDMINRTYLSQCSVLEELGSLDAPVPYGNQN
jgi:hypothetical protein